MKNKLLIFSKCLLEVDYPPGHECEFRERKKDKHDATSHPGVNSAIKRLTSMRMEGF